MKKQTTIAFAALIIFALAIVAFAYTNAKNTTPTAAVSCPMQEKHHAAQSSDTEKDSCGMANCCKDGKCSMGGACCKSGDSCPMKNKENKEDSSATADYSKVTFSGGESKEDCCKTGASCCAGGAGACCKGKHG